MIRMLWLIDFDKKIKLYKMINSVKICQRFENKCFPYLEVSGSVAWSGIVEGVHGTWYMSLVGWKAF